MTLAGVPDLHDEVELEYEFLSDGVKYSIQIVDERPNMQLDPTICLFRGDEEDPIAMIHLNPKNACYDMGHVTVRETEND
jgi:hypothetical protein